MFANVSPHRVGIHQKTVSGVFPSHCEEKLVCCANIELLPNLPVSLNLKRNWARDESSLTVGVGTVEKCPFYKIIGLEKLECFLDIERLGEFFDHTTREFDSRLIVHGVSPSCEKVELAFCTYVDEGARKKTQNEGLGSLVGNVRTAKDG
jgi:hypothetical protein